MTAERRSASGTDPVFDRDSLNREQQFALKRMEQFGWMLSFVRRPLFQEIIVVLAHQDSGNLMSMSTNGALAALPDISLRV